ncbi:hypothetical protein [Actinophytocola sp.]|uniref:hypothetical protein n=1 Tax=Actinophytocola sp. TaxID=1872138 RepID=UPI003D6ABA7E
MSSPWGDDRGEDSAVLLLPTDDEPSDELVAAWVHGALRDLPALPRLWASMVTGELVAAARGRMAAPYVLRLTVMDGRRALAVLVDECTAQPDDSLSDPSLVLVAGLSTRWGVEQRPRARTTWAELALEVPVVGLTPPGQPPMPGRRRPR